MSSFWEGFRKHAANLILITVVSGLLLAVLGTLATLALYNVALLLLVIHHWRQLTYSTNGFRLKNPGYLPASANGGMCLHA